MDIYELAFLPLNYKYGIVIYTMPCARISKDIIDYGIFSSIFFSKCDVSLPGLDFNVIRLHDTGSEVLAGWQVGRLPAPAVNSSLDLSSNGDLNFESIALKLSIQGAANDFKLV